MTIAGAQFLASHGWLGRQPAAFQAALLDIVNWRTVEAGKTFNRAGDEDGGIWGVAHGQIDITSALSAPDAPLGDVYLPGQWAGIGPVFGLPRGADGIARVPSLVAMVGLSRLKVLLAANPAWWQCIGALSTEMAFRYGGATGDLLIRGSRQRCIAVLLRLADCRRSDPPTPPVIIISHGDLAAAANMSRHPVGELLRDLQDAGHIALGYRQITILDAAALRAEVDG